MRLKFTIPVISKIDRSLIGSWKSDDKRTLTEWTWKKKLSLKRKRLFESTFGKLVVTYTPTKVISRKVISKKQTFEFIQRYSLLAADETSVAILLHGGVILKNLESEFLTRDILEAMFSKPRIVHIHFASQHCWISYGKNREWFRRIRLAR